MPHFRITLLICTAIIFAAFTLNLQRTTSEQSSLPDASTSPIVTPSTSQPEMQATASMQSTATTDIPTPSTATEPTTTIEHNPHSWPQTVINQLKANRPERIEAINHLVRATSFENFAALPITPAEQLIEYAEFVRTSAPKDIPFLCWGHETQPELELAFEGVRALAITEGEANPSSLPVFQANDRWTFTATDGNTGSSGTPVTLRWSFVPDGTSIDNDRGSVLPSDLIAQLNASYGASPVPGDLTQAPWFTIFEDAFTDWAAISGNIYIYEPNDDGASFPNSSGNINTRGDVRIGGVFIDGNSNTLAFNYFPNSGDMVIDTADSSNLSNTALTRLRFRNTIGHEHGHGLGLSHVCPTDGTKLMEPSVTTGFTGPQLDDTITIQEIYGDQLERQGTNKHNDTTLTAYNLGTLNAEFAGEHISISDSSDVDLFKFRIAGPRTLNLTITPNESDPYQEGEQPSSAPSGRFVAGCSYILSSNTNDRDPVPTTQYDPQTRQDLSLRLLASDGSELFTSNSASIGLAESLSAIPLNLIDQDYFIEVTGGGENAASGNNTQIYDLELQLVDPSQVQLSNITITQESCAPNNGAPDPGEIVSITVTTENIGTANATDVSVTLSESANLSIQGNATQTIGTLTTGNSTTTTYTCSLAGTCGDLETLTFTANTATGFTEISKVFALGTIEDITTEDFDSSNALPPGYTQSSANSDADWGIVSTISGGSLPNAVSTPGVQATNSSILTSAPFTGIAVGSELVFNHSYSLRNQSSGGILEISIDNGTSWNEWTAAGGTFSQNGYNGSLAVYNNASNPLEGEAAWTDNSGGTITTTAIFPPSAIGKSTLVRWHLGNNEFANFTEHWTLDDITLRGPVCCESIIPTISVTAPSATVEEFTPSSTSDFILTADMDVSGDLIVAYTLSGDATAGSDFVALAGSATILSGEDMAAIPVTAITDSEIEGDETLTLTLSPSVNYGIDTAAASITIKDLPFDEFRNENFGSSTTNIADDEDFDFDGIQNLAEYAFRLAPDMPTALPFSLLVEGSGGQSLELTYYEDTELPDIHYIVETSSTLASDSWTTTGVTITDGTTTNGLKTRNASIAIGNQPGFIRIRIERIVP